MPHEDIKRSVVVTGASTGIGAACARYLDRLGFQVFAGVRSIGDGRTLSASASTDLVPVYLDVTVERSIAEAVALVERTVRPAGLAGLVNNAGIAVAGPIEAVPIEHARRQLEVNVIGQMAVTQAFLPLLRHGRGRIVNMSSIAGLAATPFLGWYGASKFALEALTDALRLELRPWGIEVSSVEPGAIATPIWERSAALATKMRSTVDPEKLALYEKALAGMQEVIQKAAGRAIPADEVAKVVARALTVRRPKTRYLVGLDAQFRAFLKHVLPDRGQDWLVGKFLNLPPAP
ncbi:short-chain dehydrogenase/reductase [Nitrospira sp.]|nr:short-chain dehydrogenase/reductase [Nitrospira sp.]